MLFKSESSVLFSPYNMAWTSFSACDEESIKFSTRMNIHSGVKWTERKRLWNRRDIDQSSSIYNHFQICNTTLLSEGCSPYNKNWEVLRDVRLPWKQLFYLTRLNNHFFVLFCLFFNECCYCIKCYCMENLTFFYFQTDLSSWTNIYSISWLCHLNRCYSQWSIQNEPMIWTLR